MHQIKPLVDVVEGQLVGNEVVDIYLAVHVPVDNLWHVGSTLGATEGGALPHSARDQLDISLRSDRKHCHHVRILFLIGRYIKNKFSLKPLD